MTDTLGRLILRHRDAPSPGLLVEWELLRLLDRAGCAALEDDLKEIAGPWETYEATERLWQALPDAPGLYMFVWRPPFRLAVADDRKPGSIFQVLYVGQAGASRDEHGNTLRERYKSYRKYLRGDPERLWAPGEPVSRNQRLARYLTLRPLEYWFAVVSDRSQVENLESRLTTLLNPPINDRGRPKIRARPSTPEPAWSGERGTPTPT